MKELRWYFSLFDTIPECDSPGGRTDGIAIMDIAQTKKLFATRYALPW